MFFVSRIGQYRQVFFISHDSSDVFGGSTAFAANACRILRCRFWQKDGFLNEVMLPAITKII
jgi:hypothetical protein